MTFYDDAELAALQVVRECTEESYDSQARSKKIADEIIAPFFEQHDSAGICALIIALGRLTGNTWSMVLEKRLGHYPSRAEMLAEVDRFEMDKIEQHVAEEDDPS